MLASWRDAALVANDQHDNRLARNVEVTDERADDRVVGSDLVLEHVAAEGANGLDLDRRAVKGPRLGRQSEPAGERLESHALREGRDERHEEDRVEDRRAAGDVRRERKRREHDRHSAAQPGPREEELLACATAKRRDRYDDSERPGDEHEHRGERERRPGDRPEPAREDEQAEDDEEDDLREEREPS